MAAPDPAARRANEALHPTAGLLAGAIVGALLGATAGPLLLWITVGGCLGLLLVLVLADRSPTA